MLRCYEALRRPMLRSVRLLSAEAAGASASAVPPPPPPPPPPPRFSDLVGHEMSQTLRQRFDIHAPNAVQAEALPLALAGKDLLVCAQTGSGKTLNFLLPFLHRLSQIEPTAPRPIKRKGSRSVAGMHGRRSGAVHYLAQPEALVLVPSRELGLQIADVATQLASAYETPLGVQLLTSGERFTPQKRALRTAEARLVVATPGRLLYHIEAGHIGMRQLRMIAIDEADAVACAADGIDRELPEVLAALPRNRSRQIIFSGATLSAEHEAQLLSLTGRKPTRVSHAGVLVPSLQQQFHYIRGDKDQELVRMLERSAEDDWLSEGATMIFCTGARRAERVHDLLTGAMPELGVSLIHGESRPEAREAAIRSFTEDDTRYMVCTDVAARGLDFPEVRHVIMYDLPRDATAFIHRAGRTARRGQPGLVSCLVKPRETELYQQLRRGEGQPDSPLQQSGGRPAAARADPTHVPFQPPLADAVDAEEPRAVGDASAPSATGDDQYREAAVPTEPAFTEDAVTEPSEPADEWSMTRPNTRHATRGGAHGAERAGYNQEGARQRSLWRKGLPDHVLESPSMFRRVKRRRMARLGKERHRDRLRVGQDS